MDVDVVEEEDRRGNRPLIGRSQGTDGAPQSGETGRRSGHSREEPGRLEYPSSGQLYCLVLRHRSRETLRVGALGLVEWPRGWVYYVGRARRGWTTRVKRFNGDFTPHWHVDYLAASDRASLTNLLPVDRPAGAECALAKRVGQTPGARPVREGFGASDCSESCRAHGWVSQRDPDQVLGSVCSTTGCSGWFELLEDRCLWVADSR